MCVPSLRVLLALYSNMVIFMHLELQNVQPWGECLDWPGKNKTNPIESGLGSLPNACLGRVMVYSSLSLDPLITM